MTEKKDVVFLCQFFYPEYVSSATLPFDTALRLSEDGYRVGALCGYPYEYSSERPPNKQTVQSIEIRRLKYVKTKRVGKLGRLINYFSFILKAFLNVRKLKNCKCIVVYSNPPLLPWVAQIAKKRYGCKLIFVAYDIYPEIALNTGSISDGGLICRLMNRLNASFFACVDKVVALSEEMRSYLIENRPVSPSQVVVIPNWYKDEGLPEQTAAPAASPVMEALRGKTVISYLGNMGTCQDVDTVLEAARRLREHPEFVFLFAGHGNKVDVVKQAAAEAANVIYYDFLHGQDYLDALNCSALAVVSLERDLYGLCVPSKTYAYMMRNLPLICIMDERTDIAKDVIETGSGIVVGNGEAEKIVEFLLQKEYRSDIRRRYLEKYTPEAALEKYSALLRETLTEEL